MNILMCYLDCLRLDRVPLMTRTLRMTKRSGWMTYGNHRAVAQCSDPNFLTLLTGGTSDQHRVFTQMSTKYTKSFNTVQKQLSRAGFFTWAYEPLGAPRFYFEGFDELIRHRTHEVSPLMAPGIKQVLRESGREPWFGFMRVMDTHYPYNGEALPEAKADIPAQYDRATQHVDRLVSHLCRWVLREYPDTLIVLGSDHGEMLGDYGGMWDHLFSLRDVLTKVPLFVYKPGALGGFTSARTQHPLVTGLVLAAAGLGDWPDVDILENSEPAWLACWGTAIRDDWKHRALIVTDDDGDEWKYTVNWNVSGDAEHELHLNGDETVNYFGSNKMSQTLSGWMRDKYPTTPRAVGGRSEGHTSILRAAENTPRAVPLGGA